MTDAAWLMLGVTWSVILFFTARFFLKVMQTPMSSDRQEQLRDGILEKDA